MMLTFNAKKLNLTPGDRVLDLGCGQGRHGHALYKEQDLKVYCLELNLQELKQARSGFKLLEAENKAQNPGGYLLLQGNCLQLPFDPASLQAVICCEVLEHLQNYHQALLEIRRVLKPGGLLVLSVPRFGPERICWALSKEYQLDPGGHLRIFQAKSLRLEIQRLGFEMFAKHWAHALHSPYWWLKCLKWEKRDSWPVIKLYHRFLVWDLLKAPALSRGLERILNPVIGKSIVFYFRKQHNSHW
ncbi:MAG: methyltransferase domain-containing protein [Desulfohalobiaceae bacterium]